jgi:hypothetical protein
MASKLSGLSGLSGPFSSRGAGVCVRCRGVVEATWPWSGWRAMKRVFYGCIVLLMCLSPFFYADMFVMLPSAMLFVFGAGAMNAAARIQPTCLQCGGVVRAVQPADAPQAPAPGLGAQEPSA